MSIIKKLRLPSIQFDADLEDLDLEIRTRGCLYRLRSEGSIQTIEDLALFTVEEICKTPNFGIHTLLDLLNFMESPRLREGSDNRKYSKRTYPRIKRVEPKAAPSLTLEAEADMLLRAYASTKNRYKFLATWYGLDNHAVKNRREVADLFGVSRERSSHILKRFKASIKELTPNFPVLKNIVTIFNQSSLLSTADVIADLQRQGLTTGQIPLNSIFELAEIFGIRCDVTVIDLAGKTLFVGIDDEKFLQQLTEFIRSRAQRQAAVSVEEVLGRFAERALSDDHLRAILEHLEVDWLDQERQLFWLPSIGCRKLEHQLKKMLCNCPVIKVDELVSGTLRLSKHQRAMMPEDSRILRQLIAKVCHRLTEVRIESEAVVLLRRLDPRNHLTEAEQVISNAIREGRCSFVELRDECTNAGIPTMRFFMTVVYSPIFVRVSRGVYGLRGLTTVEAKNINQDVR